MRSCRSSRCFTIWATGVRWVHQFHFQGDFSTDENKWTFCQRRDEVFLSYSDSPPPPHHHLWKGFHSGNPSEMVLGPKKAELVNWPKKRQRWLWWDYRKKCSATLEEPEHQRKYRADGYFQLIWNELIPYFRIQINNLQIHIHIFCPLLWQLSAVDMALVCFSLWSSATKRSTFFLVSIFIF